MSLAKIAVLIVILISIFFFFFCFDFFYEQMEGIKENQTTVECYKGLFGKPVSFFFYFYLNIS